MQQNSKQQAAFAITNEFTSDIHRAQLYAKFVNNLNVYNSNWNRTYALMNENLIRNSYKNVHKLSICCQTSDNHPNAWIFPQIRHFICDSLGFDGYSGLYTIDVSRLRNFGMHTKNSISWLLCELWTVTISQFKKIHF